jgi:hypothetical protein
MFLNIGLILSVLISFLIGFKKKKFIFLILCFLVGLLFGLLSVYLYAVTDLPQEVGLGIIGILPVLFVLFSIINVFAALLSGTLGIIIGKTRKGRKRK